MYIYFSLLLKYVHIYIYIYYMIYIFLLLKYVYFYILYLYIYLINKSTMTTDQGPYSTQKGQLLHFLKYFSHVL